MFSDAEREFFSVVAVAAILTFDIMLVVWVVLRCRIKNLKRQVSVLERRLEFLEEKRKKSKGL
jgi:hypothetical protein